MATPIYLNPEQHAIYEQIKSLDERFGADETLFHSLSAIEAAKALIDKAVAAGLDERVYHPMQLWISMHDTDQGLLEHLRSWKPRP